jgi:hypothetical protein
MITLALRKDRKGEWEMRAIDGNDHTVVRSGAKSPREAARWLLLRANKIAEEIEEQIIELGYMTAAECEAVLAEGEKAE